MASFTSSQSGLWSSASTWGGAGVPGNGDTVTIQSGHTVTFDVDQSGFSSGLAGLTVNGTLRFKEDTVTYLKMANNININVYGSINIGTEDSPIQRPPTNQPFRATLQLQGTGSVNIVNQSASVTLYGWVPPKHYTTLASDAPSGSTSITLTDDLDLWNGARVAIGAGSIDDTQTETNYGWYVVTSYNPSTKTATLTSPLGHDRLAGDIIALALYPIRVLGGTSPIFGGQGTLKVKGATTYITLIGYGNQLNPATPVLENVSILNVTSYQLGEMRPYNYRAKNLLFYNSSVDRGEGWTLEDSVFIQNSTGGIRTGNGVVIKNGVFQNMKGAIHVGTEYNPSFTIFEGGIYKNLYYCPFSHCGGFLGKNINFGSMTPFNRIQADGWLINCTVNTVTFGVSGSRRGSMVQSYNHNHVDGAYRAWMRGGTVQNLNATQTEPYRYQLTSTSTTIPVYHTIQLGTLNPIEEIRVSTMIKRQTGASTKPIIQLITPLEDPLINPSIMPLAETQYPDESTGIWREVTLTYYNDKPSQIPIHFRILSMEGSGRTIEFTPPRVTNRTGLRGQKVKIMR